MLAKRLNYLFEQIHPPSGPYTNAHVAREISTNPQYGGVNLTDAYLSMLRNGRRTNPHPDLLRALAKFFGVGVGYLLGDMPEQEVNRIQEEVHLLAAMRDERVRSIALRAVGLPPDVQDSIADIITQFRDQTGSPETKDENG